MSQLTKSIESTYYSPRISLPNRLLDRLNYLSHHTTYHLPYQTSIIHLLSTDPIPPTTNHPIGKDKDRLSSLNHPKIKIHLSLRPFSFSLHLTLVNSRKNKNREKMTYTYWHTYNIIHHIYIYIHILYILFSPLPYPSHNKKNFFSLFIFIFTQLHSRKFL